MDVGRFKLKSEAPQESWQERLAVYRITHRLGLTSFAKTSLRIMTKGINKALSSSDVDQFIREVYSLDQDEAQSLNEGIATAIVEHGPCGVPQPTFDSVMLSYPIFGCNLIEAMKREEGARRKTIAALQGLADNHQKGIAD